MTISPKRDSDDFTAIFLLQSKGFFNGKLVVWAYDEIDSGPVYGFAVSPDVDFCGGIRNVADANDDFHDSN